MIVTSGDGVELTLRIQPRASRTEIVGPLGGALKLRLAAPPVDGEANDELIRFLARVLGVPKSAVEIVRGAAGRTKQVRVAGISTAHAKARLLPAAP